MMIAGTHARVNASIRHLRERFGKLGNYPILAVLPDKFARFLYEFHAFRFENLDLPPLPADRSDFDVHGALEDAQVASIMHTTQLFIYMHYSTYYASYAH